MTRHILPTVFVVVQVLLPVPLCVAQPSAGSRAHEPAAATNKTPKDRFNEGVALAGQKKYEEAIAAWLDVLGELDQEYLPKAHKALGLAYKKLGRQAEAWHHLTIYLQSSGKEDTAAGAWLEEVEKELAKGHVKVTINCQPAGASLIIDPAPAGPRPSYACPLTWWFLPGKHRVHAELVGFKAQSEDVDVRERGDTGNRQIVLAKIESERPIPMPGEIGPDVTIDPGGIAKPAEPKAQPSRALEWVLIGSGLALGITGGVLQGVAYGDNEDLYAKYADTTDFPDGEEGKRQYDAAYQDEVRPREISAYVLYGVGGAAVATGAILWLVRRPGNRTEEKTPLSLVPLSLPGGGGAVMTLEW